MPYSIGATVLDRKLSLGLTGFLNRRTTQPLHLRSHCRFAIYNSRKFQRTGRFLTPLGLDSRLGNELAEALDSKVWFSTGQSYALVLFSQNQKLKGARRRPPQVRKGPHEKMGSYVYRSTRYDIHETLSLRDCASSLSYKYIYIKRRVVGRA